MAREIANGCYFADMFAQLSQSRLRLTTNKEVKECQEGMLDRYGWTCIMADQRPMGMGGNVNTATGSHI